MRWLFTGKGMLTYSPSIVAASVKVLVESVTPDMQAARAEQRIQSADAVFDRELATGRAPSWLEKFTNHDAAAGMSARHSFRAASRMPGRTREPNTGGHCSSTCRVGRQDVRGGEAPAAPAFVDGRSRGCRVLQALWLGDRRPFPVLSKAVAALAVACPNPFRKRGRASAKSGQCRLWRGYCCSPGASKCQCRCRRPLRTPARCRRNSGCSLPGCSPAAASRGVSR